MSESGKFVQVKPRPTVEIHLPDGKVLRGPRGAKVGDFLAALNGGPPPENSNSEYKPISPPIVGAIINGQLRELTYPIQMESRVETVTMSEPDGMRIYRRSLTFLLETAFEELFPDGSIAIDHSVSSGGYYCQVTNRPPLSEDEIAKLEDRMREIVHEDLPLSRYVVPLQEAIDYFQGKGLQDKVQLLAFRKKDYVTVYQLHDCRDYLHGYMVPSTGYLRWFALAPTGHGFTLRFPRRHRPTELLPLPDYPKLLATFRLYGDWLRRLGISSAGALNDAIYSSRIREVILVSEALHEQRVADIADEVAAKMDQARLVFIAGPSASGKTTFAKRLTIQLLAHGISPFSFEMDNYFVNRSDTPRDENGDFDFESLNALDLQQLTHDLKHLVAGRSIQMPRFNFVTGQRELGQVVQLEPGQIIILEGIHGLNPQLLPDIPPDQTFRIYVSALTQLNLDRHNRVSTTDTRLLRRIIRDARERGYSALQTINRWESVRRGEKRYIFPFQENADIMFNSALAYELPVLKSLAEPLLLQVPLGTPEFIEAKRLIAFLEWFLPLEDELVPDNSILREFIGDSILREFHLWPKSRSPSKGFL
ncbi:MAG: nucleoside kinase [Chloroflexota bacterium]|nr:MAG: nucleoside kinase [Chloroflexota bacterium]